MLSHQKGLTHIRHEVINQHQHSWSEDNLRTTINPNINLKAYFTAQQRALSNKNKESVPSFATIYGAAQIVCAYALKVF